MKLVDQNTEEIYNVLEINVDTNDCRCEYQQNNWAAKQNVIAKFWSIKGFANYEGYKFKNWVEPTWPNRIKITDSQIKQIVSDETSKQWYDNLFVEPKNPYYLTDTGAIIYLNVIEPEAKALLDSIGVIVENYEN